MIKYLSLKVAILLPNGESFISKVFVIVKFFVSTKQSLFIPVIDIFSPDCFLRV